MTKQQLLNKLQLLKEGHDTEENHWAADNALLDYIDDEDVRKVFMEIEKWYA